MEDDDDISGILVEFNNGGDDGGLLDNNGGEDGGLQENPEVSMRNFFDATLPLPLPVLRTDELPGGSTAPLELFNSGERQSPLLEPQDDQGSQQLMNMWNELTKERAQRQTVEAERLALEADFQKLRLQYEEMKQQKEDLERQLQAAKPKRVLRAKAVIEAENKELKETIKTLTTKLTNVEGAWLKTKDAKMELHERLHTVQQQLQTLQQERTAELQSRIEQHDTLFQQQNMVISDLRFQLDSQQYQHLPSGHET